MALINLQGTVRSIPLHNSTHTLLTWCQSHKIRLNSTYLSGILYVLADRLRRPNSLLNRVVSQFTSGESSFSKMGATEIGLVCNQAQLQVTNFRESSLGPLAYAMDALSTEWEDTFVYACPPTPLLPKILLELQASVNCKMILVAPYWPRMHWFPLVLPPARGRKPYPLPLVKDPPLADTGQ